MLLPAFLSLHGDDIVVDGLAAGEDGELGVGAGGLEDGAGLGSLLLGDILAIVEGEEAGVGLGGVLREGAEEGVLNARLCLADTVRKVIALSLSVIGVSAPEKM